MNIFEKNLETRDEIVNCRSTALFYFQCLSLEIKKASTLVRLACAAYS